MRLTGNTETEFENRLLLNREYKYILGVFSVNIDGFWCAFQKLPNSMKFGVFVDFFDSVEIYISIESVFDRMLGYNRGFQVQIYQDGKQPITIFKDNDAFYIRSEARTAAIEKACQIRNEQLK